MSGWNEVIQAIHGAADDGRCLALRQPLNQGDRVTFSRGTRLSQYREITGYVTRVFTTDGVPFAMVRSNGSTYKVLASEIQ